MTREEWLTKFSNFVGRRVVEMYDEGDADTSLRLSCGFAPRDGRRKARAAVLLAPSCSADDSAELFVSPELSEADDVAKVIFPLVVQAWLGDWTGRNTARVVRSLNNVDTAGDALRVCGVYPHAAVTLPIRRVDGTRLLKVTCAIEPAAYVVRISRKCLNVGAPVCPCHNERMVQA